MPGWAKIIIAVLMSMVAMNTIGTVAQSFNPALLHRDAQITLLRERLADADEKIRRLEEHRAALDAYERTKEQWETEKRNEQIYRAQATAWRQEVMVVLERIEEGCHDPR